MYERAFRSPHLDQSFTISYGVSSQIFFPSFSCRSLSAFPPYLYSVLINIAAARSYYYFANCYFSHGVRVTKQFSSNSGVLVHLYLIHQQNRGVSDLVVDETNTEETWIPPSRLDVLLKELSWCIR